jgi:hypothetical protein
MNPYSERASVWPMFHSQFISAFQQHLARQLRPKYVVRMETRVFIHEPGQRDHFARDHRDPGQPEQPQAERGGDVDRGGRGECAVPAAVQPGSQPIDLSFSKLKRLLRSKGKRTVETLKTLLKKSVKAFAPAECKGYFRHAGYGSPTDATTISKRD